MGLSNASAPPPIQNLPTELKLQVLSNLSFVQLTDARAINTHFQNLIQSRDNRASLFQPLAEHYINRLQTFADHNIYYDSSVTLLEALHRWITLRGILVSSHTRAKGYGWFCEHWDEVKNGVSPSQSYGTDHTNMMFFVITVMRLHFHHHMPELEGMVAVVYPDIDAFVNACPLKGCGRFDIHRSDLERIYYTIKDTPGGYFKGDLRASSPGEEVGNKTGWGPLHGPSVFYHGGHERPIKYRGICTLADLKEQLGVPDIPERAFAYFVRTESAYRKIEHAVNTGTALKPLEKLEVLREMFIDLCVKR